MADGLSLRSLATFVVQNAERRVEYAGKEKENEDQDVIETALRDSHLLEMIAGNDLHQHKDEYQRRAN